MSEPYGIKKLRDATAASLNRTGMVVGMPKVTVDTSLVQHALSVYDALAVRLEAAERDAERYRWLRNVHAHHFFVTRVVGGATIPRFYGDELDAAIDAAREGR